MAFAPVKLLSTRWRGVSVLLTLAALFLAAAWSWADKPEERGFDSARPRPTPSEAEGRSLLLFPVQSHWLSQPLAAQMTAALAESLAGRGLAVIVYDQNAPMFHYYPQPTDVPITTLADRYSVLADADASLVARLSETETELAAEVKLEGAVSKRSTTFELRTPVSGSKQQAARELARQIASALTPEAWIEIGANAQGRKQAAAERYADGQKAMEQQDVVQASIEFEAAIAGDPDRSEYFAAAAEAQMAAFGDYNRALVLLRRASTLAPNDINLLLRQGDAALLANRPEEAEGAFRLAQGVDPLDLRALEGMARSARAQNQFDRSVSYYQELVAHLPGLAEEPPALPRLLAGAGDDTVRLTMATPDELPRELGLLYLGAGQGAAGARQLLAYHQQPDRPPYTEDQYLAVSAGMDVEAEAVAREAQAALAERDLGEASEEQAEEKLKALHDRSDNLATVGERMQPPAQWGAAHPARRTNWTAAHAYRVLAYNLLNQSNFEAILYVQTADPDRLRRAEFWRKAYREAVSQALELQTTGAQGLPGRGSAE
jgi:Tfp pilus assembly protein PilF